MAVNSVDFGTTLWRVFEQKIYTRKRTWRLRATGVALEQLQMFALQSQSFSYE